MGWLVSLCCGGGGRKRPIGGGGGCDVALCVMEGELQRVAGSLLLFLVGSCGGDLGLFLLFLCGLLLEG